MTIWMQDIHSEFVGDDGAVIWGYTELDRAADMHGLDDVIVARCGNCGSQLFTSVDEQGDVWLHVTEGGGCDVPTPIW
jgi:hypothetical protein